MRYTFRPAFAAVAALALLLLCDRPGFAAAVFDDAADAAAVMIKFSTGPTTLAVLTDGVQFRNNRPYAIRDIPDEVVGLTFTQRPGSDQANVVIDAPAEGSMCWWTATWTHGGRATAGKRLIRSWWTQVGHS